MKKLKRVVLQFPDDMYLKLNSKANFILLKAGTPSHILIDQDELEDLSAFSGLGLQCSDNCVDWADIPVSSIYQSEPVIVKH